MHRLCTSISDKSHKYKMIIFDDHHSLGDLHYDDISDRFHFSFLLSTHQEIDFLIMKNFM